MLRLPHLVASTLEDSRGRGPRGSWSPVAEILLSENCSNYKMEREGNIKYLGYYDNCWSYESIPLEIFEKVNNLHGDGKGVLS